MATTPNDLDEPITAQPEPIIGIDLGTTNSLVAFATNGGPQIIRTTANGQTDSGIVPSVITWLTDEGRPIVGQEARAHAVERPLSTVFSVKRLMGRGFDDVQGDLPHLAYKVVRREATEQKRDLVAVQIGDRVLTPPELSALILKELAARAERHFGRTIKRAVITAPAYFDDAQRQATRDAGRIAGLEVVRIINEPTAAALAYGLDRTRDGRVVIYDLGGGTFDVTVLQIQEGVFEVLSAHGNTHLGGDDFDREIVMFVQQEVSEQFGIDIRTPATKQALRNLAEAVKIRLSTDQQATLRLDLGRGRTYERVLTRDEFEKRIDPWVGQTIIGCGRALADARLNPDDIDQVVMVGGSTRMPLVRRRVEQIFGKKPYTAVNPEEVVALGAAVQAAVLQGTRRDVFLLDVTPLSLGIETMGGAMGKLILRNTRIPCTVAEKFTTFVDGQTSIKINVLQGERELAHDCRSLGEFDLRDIPPMPAGIPKLEVTFMIDSNGILNVSAREERSGKSASIQVVPAHGLTGQEVEHIAAEAVQYARQDMLAHQLIDLRNQVTFDTTKAEQMLAKVGDQLPPELRRQIEQGMAELRKLAETTDDAPLLQQQLHAFGRTTVRLAELAITAALQDKQAPDGVRPPTKRFKVTFLPTQRTVEVNPGELPYGEHGLPGSILDIALHHAIDLGHACGGVGACSTCHVIVRQGLRTCSQPSEAEEDQLDNAYGVSPRSRLACQCIPDGSADVVVEIPDWNRNLAREER